MAGSPRGGSGAGVGVGMLRGEWIPFIQIKNQTLEIPKFQVLKFQISFKVPKSQKLQSFKVSKFQCFKVLTFQSIEVPQIQTIPSMFFDRYRSDI